MLQFRKRLINRQQNEIDCVYSVVRFGDSGNETQIVPVLFLVLIIGICFQIAISGRQDDDEDHDNRGKGQNGKNNGGSEFPKYFPKPNNPFGIHGNPWGLGSLPWLAPWSNGPDGADTGNNIVIELTSVYV